MSKLVFNGFQMFSHCFWSFSAISAWFLTVFKTLKSDSDLFQYVLNWFLMISKCFEKFCDHFVSHLWWFHTFKKCQISVSDAFSKLQKTIQTNHHLANARCLPGVADQKLGSRMHAPIFVFARVLKFHHSCGHFNRFAVNGKSLKMAATLGHYIKCVERERWPDPRAVNRSGARVNV